MTPEAAIRGPVEFWEDHLRWGSGGTCFASSYAYPVPAAVPGLPLAAPLLPPPRREAPGPHRAPGGGRGPPGWWTWATRCPPRWPFRPGTGRAGGARSLRHRDSPGAGRRVPALHRGRPGAALPLPVHPRAAADGAYLGAWARTFASTAPYMRRLALGRFRDRARYLYKEPGRVYAIAREGEREMLLEAPPGGGPVGVI